MPAFADMEGKDMFIESDLDPELLDFRKNNDTVKRSKISVYIGKGIVRPLPDSIKNPLGIAKGMTSSDQIILIKRDGQC